MPFLRFFQLIVELTIPEMFEPPSLRLAHVPERPRALRFAFSFALALAFRREQLRFQLLCLFQTPSSFVTQPARFDLAVGEAVASVGISGLPA
jgi:hypothetical protein